MSTIRVLPLPVGVSPGRPASAVSCAGAFVLRYLGTVDVVWQEVVPLPPVAVSVILSGFESCLNEAECQEAAATSSSSPAMQTVPDHPHLCCSFSLSDAFRNLPTAATGKDALRDASLPVPASLLQQ